MKLIAHRGLFQGPDKNLENHPDQINRAISEGYDCEIDLRVVDSELWLGHDYAQYYINKDFLIENQYYLWIHAKNLAALRWLSDTDFNYFWHEDDHYVLTSHRFIWSRPGANLTMRNIQVMPELTCSNLSIPKNCYGICSDYVEKIKTELDNRYK